MRHGHFGGHSHLEEEQSFATGPPHWETRGAKQTKWKQCPVLRNTRLGEELSTDARLLLSLHIPLG